MEFEKIVSIMLILIVVIIVIVAFSGKLYAVIKPALNWEVKISEEGNKALGDISTLYSKCMQSSSTNCVCIDDKDTILGETDYIRIEDSPAGQGIKIGLLDIRKEVSFRIVGGVNHCSYPTVEDISGNEKVNSPVVFYEVNGKLKVEGKEILGDASNPLVLYKWNKDGKNYLCFVTNDVYLSRLPTTSCF